jgi:hypothetical protein
MLLAERHVPVLFYRGRATNACPELRCWIDPFANSVGDSALCRVSAARSDRPLQRERRNGRQHGRRAASETRSSAACLAVGYGNPFLVFSDPSIQKIKAQGRFQGTGCGRLDGCFEWHFEGIGRCQVSAVSECSLASCTRGRLACNIISRSVGRPITKERLQGTSSLECISM